MYDSIILRTVAKVMLPVLLLISLFMLVRGHNLPGGGFIGGLLAAAGIILQIVAYGADRARSIIPVNYIEVAAVGVTIAAISGLLGLLSGLPFMAAFWIEQPLPGIGKLGTPFLFDIGVYITVIGVTTQLALTLAEEPSMYPPAEQPAQQQPVAPEA
jgi:multicomponent Na+:H+ antiporter subunit B